MHLLLLPPTLCSLSPLPPHRHLHFRTRHRQNLRYLKTLGITPPDFHSPQTLSQILSTLNYFKSKGFSEPDFPRIAFLSPHLFTPTFDPIAIEPVFDFLTVDLAASPEEIRGLILKCPHILESDPDLCLKPTLSYLKKLGIKQLKSPTTLNAHLLDTRVEKLEEKMRFLRSVGFSVEESRRICGRFPAIFGYGIEHNLRPKFEYLRKEMKRNGREEVNKFPQYFGFSLEKRIKPRYLHLKQRNVDGDVPLNRMLLWSDERFFKKWK
ncbi:transcription termination factor MTEF1, chloroplastic [Cynara cardunculus var. scolymus]|uniref:transcription termination factor MTEF1, chloroplastic n=1 Tax=Cynara cardunculus var. scolymus TaxID=59895 RepID=UPI000D62A25E|nr:transcription termination factor MTEF1, chloroplastic [Cynara cardunculus var. scolymus]